LANCYDYLTALKATSDLIGPLALSSLAFLIAVLALLGDFSRDKIVVERGFHLLLEWAIRMLVFEVIAWVLVDILTGTPSLGFLPCVTWVVVSVRIAMLSAAGGVAILLAIVVHKIGAILKTRYRS
jgi:hypothetical protein